MVSTLSAIATTDPTAVSGSGPAYFFLLVEALEDAGTALGLPPATARHLAVHTALGAGRMVTEGTESPATLREQVTSKGGTTAAALDVLERADMFAHHHVSRERLSVRQRMSDVLGALRSQAFVEFTQLFRPEEGRMGVTVTFSAILELLREGLVEIVQSEPFAPIHVRAGAPRHVTLVVDNDRPDIANRNEP